MNASLVVLLLPLLACSAVPTQPPPQSTTTTLDASSLGTAIEISATTMALDCNSCARTGHWPNVTYGTLRLWDSGVNWALLEPSKKTFDWSTLDTTLDYLQQSKVQAIYVFGHVPCWATTGACETDGSSTAPPTDTQDFLDFVTALVTHCNSKQACVSDLVKVWEMWNEPNSVGGHFWSGTSAQLLTLVQGAYPIIKNNVRGAQITTPSPTDGGGTRVSWMTDWLAAGGASYADVLAYHAYLDTTPEQELTVTHAMQTVAAQNGMGAKPEWNTEGGWHDVSCPTSLGPSGCIGQLARWYILQLAAGVSEFTWYSWDEITPAAPAYGVVSQWLVGARFSEPCSVDSDGVWTCSLARGASIETIAWNPNGDASYTTSANSYEGLDGVSHPIPSTGRITIGVEPLLLSSP